MTHAHTPVFTVAWSNSPLPVPGCQLWHRYRISYQHQGHAICYTRTAAYVNLRVIGTLPHMLPANRTCQFSMHCLCWALHFNRIQIIVKDEVCNFRKWKWKLRNAQFYANEMLKRVEFVVRLVFKSFSV